jgi:hypothetical protein
MISVVRVPSISKPLVSVARRTDERCVCVQADYVQLVVEERTLGAFGIQVRRARSVGGAGRVG